jgi:hypothetical protein
MEKTVDCSPEQLVALKSAYEDFKREAKERKSAVKNGKTTVAEFMDWILEQSRLYCEFHYNIRILSKIKSKSTVYNVF